ncbi:hypothetical protein FDI23_gp156 [Serratia phage CHI14]|uniref:Uncharacterized protein n=2 Tax=Winklervirus chi14 TaxID=2560752 RepID=A0A1Z1LYS9_9CAUD|nr:hypothetical protein FDI23_gp156 [Serratia phage CHI14]ARW57682.1 hypothetical protein [Serratia phage CHI14]ARW57957.1 hypothetical protein [Serratia phage CBH8]UJJ22254.1 hypothetical protein [Erwinia phage Virsaitis27]
MEERNWVAKNDFNRASVHKDKKKAQQESKRKQKHKGKYDEPQS